MKFKALLFVLTTIMSSHLLADENAISVSGQSSIAATPQHLSFTLYLQEKGPVASKLNMAITHKSEQVVSALMQREVSPDDIQSMQVQLQPWFERTAQGQEQKGLILSRQINVKLRNLEQYPDIIDAILKIGPERMGDFQYGLDNSDEIYLQALTMAIDDAKNKAEKLASSLGVKVGKVISAREFQSHGVMPMARQMTMKSEGAYMPGQMNINANVEVQFAIK